MPYLSWFSVQFLPRPLLLAQPPRISCHNSSMRHLSFWMIKEVCILACWIEEMQLKYSNVLHREPFQAFLWAQNLFCMRLQKDISEKTLNKLDKDLSLIHTLMPILMKYPMKDNKGGWYHRRQRKTSGYILCMMQTLLCLAFEKLLHCELAPRDMFTSAHNTVSPISSEITSATRWCNENVSHGFVRILCILSTGSVPCFAYAKPLLVLHGRDHFVCISILHSTMHSVLHWPENLSVYFLAR